MSPISPNISPSSSVASLSILSPDGSSDRYKWADALPEWENPWKSSGQETNLTLSGAGAESSTKVKVAYINSLVGTNLQPPTEPVQQPNDLNSEGRKAFTPQTMRFSASFQQLPFTQNSQGTSQRKHPLLHFAQKNDRALRSTSSTKLMPNASPFRRKVEQFSLPSSETASEKLKKAQVLHDCQKTQEIMLEDDWWFNLDSPDAQEITSEDDSRSTLDTTN